MPTITACKGDMAFAWTGLRVAGRLLVVVALVVLGGQLLPRQRSLGESEHQQQRHAAAGKRLAEQLGCQVCHSTDGSAGVGPTWQNLADGSVKLADGTTVTADDAYLVRSILDADAEIVSGYRGGSHVGAVSCR